MISSERNPTSITNLARSLTTTKIPKNISERFRHINKKGMSLVDASLKETYFTQRDTWFDAAYLSSDEGQNDLQNHLFRRIHAFRETVTPRLSNAKLLSGSRILKVGCGTGAATVALAEQGAAVTAVDFLGPSGYLFYKVFPHELLHVARYDERLENVQYQNWLLISKE